MTILTTLDIVGMSGKENKKMLAIKVRLVSSISLLDGKNRRQRHVGVEITEVKEKIELIDWHLS